MTELKLLSDKPDLNFDVSLSCSHSHRLFFCKELNIFCFSSIASNYFRKSLIIPLVSYGSNSMFPKPWTSLKHTGIVIEMVEFFNQILGMDVILSDCWSQNLLCTIQKSQMLKGNCLGQKECMFFFHRYSQTITLFLHQLDIPKLVLWRWNTFSVQRQQ